VVTAVANGDLKQNLTVKSKGEVAALADTINNMTETLATFADQVTSVAREVGVEGRLGGRANVPGAAGTWKDLTGNVNLLAANLTSQVRAIAKWRPPSPRATSPVRSGRCARRKSPSSKTISTMIGNLRLDRRQYRTGLAEDQPRQNSPTCCRASATSPPSAGCCSPN
jgi:hypothetical protein